MALRSKLAKDLSHREDVIVHVLAEDYRWTRAQIADFLKQLRKYEEKT
jgi:hypothetical protein